MTKIKQIIPVLLATVLALMALPAVFAAPAEAPTAQGNTIVDIAVADGRFNTLVAAVSAAGLVDTLAGPGPFTVFAPTDGAFAKLPAGTVEALLGDIPTLTRILLYHVVAGEVKAADVVKLNSAMTAAGIAVNISTDGRNVYINDSKVIITDIQASNGVIHVIDTVLLPPTQAQLDACNGTDYRVRNGNSLSIIARNTYGNSRMFAQIVAATNAANAIDSSYARISDSNLIFPGTKLCLPALSIVDIAVADGRFNTLVTAVTAAGLAPTLDGPGSFTVFAPTDSAFAKLPAGTIPALLNDIPTLTDILLYHVVPGQVYASQVVNLTSANTLLGQPVSVSVKNGRVFINDSRVLITNIQASNGVIHVIDTVLLP